MPECDMTSAPPSPITVDLLLSGAVGISEVVTDDGALYWAENRPNEGGRAAIMRHAEGVTEEVTGPDANVRTRVHEYGGGAWWAAGGQVIFSDDARGGELFLLDTESSEEHQLTSDGHRYADGRRSTDGTEFLCVRERHHGPAATDVENDVVAVALDGSGVRQIIGGHDFFSGPRQNQNGQVVVVAWDHPNMPWDETHLIVVDPDGTSHVVPGEIESVVLADWTADGRLLAVTDRSNWWNLVQVDPTNGEHTPIVAGEFEVATPGWVFGLSTWVETAAGIVAVLSTPNGDRILFPDGSTEDRHTSVTSLRSLGSGVAYAASSFGEESAVWTHDGTHATRVSTPRDLGLGPEWFPAPQHLTFPVGTDGGVQAHALFYEPANPDVAAAGLPPLLVMVHGGPTSAARRTLNMVIRFWTSRGVAVADVDYRGSTLYGRDFRHALRGGWGEYDVLDCVAAAQHLAESGRVDPERMVIAGGSAGGLTVLNALAHHGVFSGGISRYGVGDLGALAADTHKFEARYMDRLVGPWPEAKETYTERSPLTHIDGIAAPMLVLQGTEDKIVPPNQAEAIVAALTAKDIPVTYHLFEAEGHGFRMAETIRTALGAEEAFIFGL